MYYYWIFSVVEFGDVVPGNPEFLTGWFGGVQLLTGQVWGVGVIARASRSTGRCREVAHPDLEKAWGSQSQGPM